MHATFPINGQIFMGIDSTVEHAFTFTPTMSLYVKCETEEEIDRLYREPSQARQVFKPLDRYPFSDEFAWVSDRFGVSWQLNAT